MFKARKRTDETVKFDVKSVDKGHHEVLYRGVKAIRCPFDYLIYQMIIEEVRPDLVIEIGSRFGGGAYYIADLLSLIGHGEVHCIDIEDNIDPIVKEHPKIKFFFEGWQNYDLLITNTYNTILVIEDASHTYEDSIGALNKFNTIVSENSYYIVEDGIVNKLGLEKKYNGGPLKAISEFLPEHPEFIVEKKWCNMFGINATFNVNGYLRKTR